MFIRLTRASRSTPLDLCLALVVGIKVGASGSSPQVLRSQSIGKDCLHPKRLMSSENAQRLTFCLPDSDDISPENGGNFHTPAQAQEGTCPYLDNHPSLQNLPCTRRCSCRQQSAAPLRTGLKPRSIGRGSHGSCDC